jgi:hypothetical protein
MYDIEKEMNAAENKFKMIGIVGIVGIATLMILFFFGEGGRLMGYFSIGFILVWFYILMKEFFKEMR